MSTSSSIQSMQSSSSAAPITSASLLSQHASSSNPYAAALEQAVTDRNSLAAQNTQLWKLVEKQRAGYSQILRELERVRGERDAWKSRAGSRRDDHHGAGHTNGVPSESTSRPLPSRNDDHAPRSSSSASSHSHSQISALHSERQRAGSASSVQSLPNPHASSSSPVPPPNTIEQTNFSNSSSNPPASTSSPSNSSINHSFPSLGSSPVHTRSVTTHPPLPPTRHHHSDSSNSSQRPQSPSQYTPNQRHVATNPSPLVQSVRAESMPTKSPQGEQPQPTFNSSRKMSLTEISEVPPPTNDTRSLHSPPQPTMLSPDPGLASPNPPFMHSRPSRDSQGSHDSRITLPEEARAYIVNMADSPIPSPRLGQFTSQPSGLALGSVVSERSTAQNVFDEATHPLVVANRAAPMDPVPELEKNGYRRADVDVSSQRGPAPPVVTIVPASAGPSASPASKSLHLDQPQNSTNGVMLRPGKSSPPTGSDLPASGVGSMFLDMGEESGVDDGSGLESDFNDQGSFNDLGAEGSINDGIAGGAADSRSQGSTNRISESMERPPRGKPRAAVADFPLPPGSPPESTTHSNLFSEPPSYDAGLNSANLPLASASTSTTTLLSASSSNVPSAMTSSTNLPSASSFLLPSGSTTITMSAQDGENKFRALPLLPHDLPYTTVTVSSSFVRPNERGKEVLSFTVHVYIDRDNGSRKSRDHNGDRENDKSRKKDAWTVEKMYSDVLALDQRVRASVGRNVGKKIAALPEGRLWKDHAPAKVDQRKAVLENYLQTLVSLPIKNNDEVIAFLTTDIVRDANKPVLQAGHKEGYLTKRGKNFGGWKTRYFVLQGPVLEYYDCRGGTHLGSIQVAGAQIGRQQRSEARGASDDEKEYRHAFLIVENRKNAAGSHPRHVLCAESDEDRDSWVEMLVRYFTGIYTEEPVTYSARGASPIATNTQASESAMALPNGHSHPPPRSSNSIDIPPPYSSRGEGSQRRAMSKDDIMISKGTAIPISRLAPDASHAKFFQSAPIVSEPSPVKTQASPVDREKLGGLPSSLPDSGPLSALAQDNSGSNPSPLRSNSEMGHYPDAQDRARQHSPEKHREKDRARDIDFRKSTNPPTASSATSVPPSERVPSPDKMDKVKISGPLNGAPIPAGYKFGNGAPEASPSTPSDRREKAKSRSFWGFGRPNDKLQPLPTFAPRAVFGVPLEESLDVAQIANLPAIVFRSIQYLEAKQANQEEGIYRLSGSTAVIKGLRDRFNAEGDVDLLSPDEFWDPHAIAGLLKSFLRELPSSILTRDHHLKFLSVMDLVDPQERIKELSQLIAALPLANYSLLRALTAHLILVVQNSNVNKMTMRNVGIVFSPTLGIPAGIFSLMLGEFNRVFNVDAADGNDPSSDSVTDGPGALAVDGAKDRVELARRNSQRYSDTAADKLLGLEGRKLTVSTEEGQSDGDDISFQDENGAETTDDGSLDASTNSRSAPSTQQARPAVAPETPTASRTSKASHVAATRGLNVSVTPSDRGHRYSRMMGLPASPRPPITPSPEHTPQ